MENSPYMDAITAQRSLLLDDEQALEGLTTISFETQSDGNEGFSVQYRSNFPLVLKAIRLLPREDQQLVLSYYGLGKCQRQLANIQRTTQTLCSSDVRHAVQQVGCYLLFGGVPTEAQMREVFIAAGVEGRLRRGLAWSVARYTKCRSYQQVAEESGEHRPRVRRVLVDTGAELTNSDEAQQRALGAYMQSLTEKASALGAGMNERKLRRQGHMMLRDSELLGTFNVNLAHPEFDQLFASQATL